MERDHTIVFAEAMELNWERHQRDDLASFLGPALLAIAINPEQDQEKTSEVLSLAARKANTDNFMDMLVLHNEAMILRETIESCTQEVSGSMPGWLTHISDELSRVQAEAAMHTAEVRARQIEEEKERQTNFRRREWERERPSSIATVSDFRSPFGPFREPAPHIPGTTI